jgi:hypothetical protein
MGPFDKIKGLVLASLGLFRPYCNFSATAAEYSMASTEPQQHEAEAAPIPIASTHNTVKCHLNSEKILISSNRIQILEMTPILQPGTNKLKALTIFCRCG